MLLIILASFALLSLCKHCSVFPQDYTKIVGKENEKIVQDLGNYFGQITYKDVVTLRDENSKLSLLNPISLVTKIEMPRNINQIISYSALTSPQFQLLNKYQLLATQKLKKIIDKIIIMYINNEDDLILIWTEQFVQNNFIKQLFQISMYILFVAGAQGRMPKFDSNKIIGKANQVNCQSSIILDPKHFLIDCYQVDAGNLNNQFYLINQDKEEIIKIDNSYPLLTVQKRYKFIKFTNNYIYRITTHSSENPSYIEIFTYDLQKNEIQRKKIIDQELVLNYIIMRKYDFELVDVKVGPLDQILILDTFGNVFSMKWIIDQDSWEFDYLVMNSGYSISFDYSFKSNILAVLQPSKIIFGRYFTKEYNSIEDLSGSKIHMTNNFLYLVSSTKIISFQLGTYMPIYETAGDFSKLQTGYTENDFLVLSNTNIKHYQGRSEYQIQYINNQPELKGIGILKYNQCQVTIEYQTVARDSKQLILVSKENIIDTPFLSDTIYLPKSYSNHINKLVDGPMQQISFQKNQNSNSYQSGNLSYIGIAGDLKTVYESDELSLKNIIFTQTISMLNSQDNNYVIITQNQELELKIYSCYFTIAQACTISYETSLTLKITSENTATEDDYDIIKKINKQFHYFIIIFIVSNMKIILLNLSLYQTRKNYFFINFIKGNISIKLSYQLIKIQSMRQTTFIITINI